VVADSCYAGLLSTDPSYLFAAGSSGGYTKEYIAYKLPKRARLLIASGGDQPVLDTGGGANSVFALAFVERARVESGHPRGPGTLQPHREARRGRRRAEQNRREAAIQIHQGRGARGRRLLLRPEGAQIIPVETR
jgi:hypothetical protein